MGVRQPCRFGGGVVSTPNPTRIIAEHLHADTFTARNRVTKERAVVTRCLCGDTVPAEDFAAHVVSELTDAGYSIIPSDGIVRTYQATSTLGSRYMLPKHFGCDREEAERWFKLHQSALDGLPGVDTVRLEYQDMWVTTWEPLDAARAAGGQA